MRKPVCAMLLGFSIWMAGCESGVEDGKEGGLIGTWSWPHQLSYRMADSLYRDSLRSYYAGNGIDLDRYFSFNDGYRDSVPRAVFDSLLEAFRFTCPAPDEVCAETLWVEKRSLRFDADSVHYRAYRDSAGGRGTSITDAWDYAYSVRNGRLIRYSPLPETDTLEFSIRNQDTLILGPDTLVRSR